MKTLNSHLDLATQSHCDLQGAVSVEQGLGVISEMHRRVNRGWGKGNCPVWGQIK